MSIVNYKLNVKCKCKKCGYELSAALGTDEGAPSEGNISICGGCAAIGKYKKNLKIIPLSKTELEQMKKDYYEDYLELMVMVNLVKSNL